MKITIFTVVPLKRSLNILSTIISKMQGIFKTSAKKKKCFFQVISYGQQGEERRVILRSPAFWGNACPRLPTRMPQVAAAAF